ncbi:AraC family transcriptional regulator [Desulfosarcina ovata]|uniref:AraC family transcriptional regulator n=1 Tax=Desulfosarcina ovata TaxID=83564 RepID=UPI001567097D|nr:AraC family transcriptional regulator [Desulfosarcina ovata]
MSVDAFASGLQLRIIDAKLDQITTIKGDASGFEVGVGFCLAGFFESRSGCSKNPVYCEPNLSGFFFFPELMDATIKVACQPMMYAVIGMETETLFGIVERDEQRSLSVLKKLEKNDPFIIPDALTPAMRRAFQQIFNCPFSGPIRQLFLEGKLMELLAHKLDQLHSGKAPIRNPYSLKPKDIERVRHAADLLVSDLENPPDMSTLARSVGLSRSTLYRHFNQLYNLSPFEYLRNHRLQTAMHLLQEGEVNVTEAAITVGYLNMSHFAKAFKAMFGIPPSAFLNHSTPAQSI